MLRSGGSARDRFERDEYDALEVTVFVRCVEGACCSCILPFQAVLGPLSLPLSVFLVLFCEVLSEVLRSSVTLDELTSFRSSSLLCVAVAEGIKLIVAVSEVCG